MAPKKSNYRKPAAKRASAQKRPQRKAMQLYDGQKLLLSTYAEVHMPAGINGGVMAYSLICDPLDMKLKLSGAGVTASDGVNAIASDSALSFPRLEQFKNIYRQYKLDWVKLSITTDRDCGLDNPVIALTDKGNSDTVSSVASAMSQAHKESILTESKRTCSYGWKPSTSAEKDFRMTGTAVALAEQNVIKVLQDVEGHDGKICKHRITVTASVSLKDSKSPN